MTELRYCGSVEAVASLKAGGCEIAGFHMPVGEFQAEGLAHYARWLAPASRKLISIASRRVGLMGAQGDAEKVYGNLDLARSDGRFIDRQSGSAPASCSICCCAKAVSIRRRSAGTSIAK